MILYAPAWLRRWRRWLVLPLHVAGVLAFGALALLPAFEHDPAAHGVAALAGITAWTLLVFLMNGEPLPSKVPFEAAAIDEEGAIDFDVRVNESQAIAAQAEFWMRSVRELRLGTVVVTPILTAFFFAITWKIGGDSLALTLFGLFLLMAVMAPVGLFFAGKAAAAEQARRIPERHVRVSRQGIAVGASDGNGLAWSNVVRVWESERTLTLVLNPYMAVQLPREQVPAAARDAILAYFSRRW